MQDESSNVKKQVAKQLILPGIRDRLLVTLSEFEQDADHIGIYHNDNCEINLDLSQDKYRLVSTFWHEVWHMIQAQFDDITGKDKEEIEADLFAQLIVRLIGVDKTLEILKVNKND